MSGETLTVGVKLTLDGKEYVATIDQSAVKTKAFAAGVKELSAAHLAATQARAREAAETSLAIRQQADLADQRQRQTARIAEQESAAAAFVAGLKRETETMGLSRAEMIRYEAKQLSLTDSQKRLVDAFARKIEAPKWQSIDQQGIDAATRALEEQNKELALAARNAMTLEVAEARLNAQLQRGQINEQQHADGLRRVRTELQGAGNDANNAASNSTRLGSSIQGVARAAVGLVALGAISAYAGQALQLTEGYARLESQLKLTTENHVQLANAQQAVARTSKAVGSPLQETASLYTKLSPAMKEAGQGQAQVAAMTDLVAKSLRIGNATTAESSSVMLQFGQAMSSGVLQGDEFKSLMEAAPVLMRKLADGLGVPIGALKQMGAESELTSERVITALLKSKDAIDRDFAKLPQTVSVSWQRLTNEVQTNLGELDNGTGITQTLAKGIDFLTANLTTAATAVGLVGTAFAGLKLASIAAAWTPVGAAILVAGAAAVALAKGVELVTQRERERQAQQQAALTQQAEENKLQKEINAARLKMREIKAPAGYEEALRRISQALREGKISTKDAGVAMNAYVEAADTGAAKLAKAKTNFEAFLPNSKKVKDALAQLDAEYKISQEAGVANEAAYQARRNKIIQDGFKEQLKLRDDLVKDAAARELTTEQQKVAAVIAEQKKRVADAQGNATLILAAEREGVRAVAQVIVEGERQKLTATKEGVTARVKATEDALEKSLAAERSIAERIGLIQERMAETQRVADDKLREIRRKGMTEREAEADRQEEMAQKFADAEELMRKGESEAAIAISKKALALGEASKSFDVQAEAVQRAADIEQAAIRQQQDAAEKSFIAQQQRSEALRQQLAQEKVELDRVSQAVADLDSRLADPRKLDIETGPALRKIDEVKRRLSEISTNTLQLQTGFLGIDTPGLDGFATGGRLHGPGTPTSDSILIRGSVDEFMVNAWAARRVGYGVMDYINTYGALPVGHATGGRLGQPAPPPSMDNGGTEQVTSGGGNVFHIAQLVLPDVKDIEGFVKALEDRSRTQPLRINTVAAGRRNG